MLKLVAIAALAAAFLFAATDPVHAADETGVQMKQVADGIEKSAAIAQKVAEDIAKVTATIVKVAKIASQIGQAFQYIGPAFALISVFLPSQEDLIMQQIQDGFKQMHERFDKVDHQLQEIKDQILIGNSYAPYRAVQDKLDVLWSTYDTLRKSPNNTVYRKDLTASCEKNDPKGKLVLVHKYVIEKGMGMDLLQAMLKDSQYNNTILSQLFAIVIRDITKAAFLRQTCLGLLPGDNKETMKQDAESAGKQIEAIYNALDDYKTLYRTTLFKEELIKDMNTAMIAKRNSISIKEDLWDLLQRKYTFTKWTVVIYDTKGFLDACSGNRHHMQPEEKGNGKYHLGWSDNVRQLYVIWTEDYSFPKMRALREEAYTNVTMLSPDSGDPKKAADTLTTFIDQAKSVLVITHGNCVTLRAGEHTMATRLGKGVVVVNF